MSTELDPAEVDTYPIVTDHFISQLERGTIPWCASFYEAGYPQNYVTGRRYVAINTWLLASLGYKRNLFLTEEQMQQGGWRVKKGEKGHLVTCSIPTAEKKLWHYLVYNVAQTNIPPEKIPAAAVISDPDTVCKLIVNGMPNKPEIDDWGNKLFYNPESDTVHLPAPEFVPDYRDYYSALFYALIHSTAHPDRLNRPACMANTPAIPKQYNRSELTWAIASSLLCSLAGIPPVFIRKYSYGTEGWLRAFNTDKKMIVDAAEDALRAVQYILNEPVEENQDGEIMELS